LLSVSKQASKDALRAFEEGLSNLLISTSVAEEGLDIPEANCAIYFDAMDHAVSYVQGRGRARHIKSSFVMLNKRENCPASVLANQEAQQHAVASSFVPKNTAANNKLDQVAQKSRERGVLKYLLNPTEDNCIANLNIYRKKTNVALEENVVKNKMSNCFSCKLNYRSSTLTASESGNAQSKKKAKKIAAIELLKAIKSSAQICKR
jgi:superfamily II DNA/RNA helicase